MLPAHLGTQNHRTVRRKYKVIGLVTVPAKPIVLYRGAFIFLTENTYHAAITQMAQFSVTGGIEAVVYHISPNCYMDAAGVGFAPEVDLSYAD
jgi:hypothetical protein